MLRPLITLVALTFAFGATADEIPVPEPASKLSRATADSGNRQPFIHWPEQEAATSSKLAALEA